MRRALRFEVAARFLATSATVLWGYAAAAEPVKVIVFGDSLSSGYQLQADQAFPAVLERKLKAAGHDVVVLNMSVPGETTTTAKDRVQSVILQRPDIVLVELGANDALRGIDPYRIVYHNLYAIVYTLNKMNGIEVIMIGMKAPLNMGKAYAAKFEAAQATVAQALDIWLYPFFLKGVAGNPKYNLADGYHPNVEGVKIMADALYPRVEWLVRWKADVKRHKALQDQQP